MEMGSKFPRIRCGNGRSESVKVGRKREEQEEEEEGGKRPSALDIASAGGLGRLCGWPSSRIVRVSRASGGKDRHSKVWTSKGLRDRRVRLSVNTAIQFYDLQDRLGYDQPSKAVEWLLKAASASIDELPSINTSFPSTPGQQASDEMEMEGELYQHQQQQQGNNFSKSACSSTSETSKGSGLSLSRCESRIKARERARGRAAEKDKEKEKEHQNVSQSSFTDLLTGGNGNANTPSSPNQDSPASRQWCSAPMDYFAAGLLGLSSTPSSSPNLLPQIHPPPLYNVPGEHYSFLPDHLSSNSNANANNLAFTTSPGYTGFNRGTLQSNSPSSSLLPHQLHSFSSSSPLFTATAPPVEDHHHFLPGFDARLQLCYGDGGSHSDQKGKVKN